VLNLSSSVVNTVSNLHVLVIGLDPYRVPGPWNPKPVADAIDIGMTALADRGFHAEACLVGLDGSDDIEARGTAAFRPGRGTASLSVAESEGPRNNWSFSNPSST
jgi:hypothetical protein